MIERKRVLVTGGAGFIGSHLVDALLQQGHEVGVLDDFSTGTPSNLAVEKVTLYEGDITDEQLVEKVLRDFRPHNVSHHAAQISVIKSIENPKMDANINVMGSLNILDACSRHGIEHFVFASTGGALYGNPEHTPCAESHPIRPLAPYGASKYAVETFLGMYRSAFGLKGVALRYANVYGPRQSHMGEAGVIAIFAGQMLKELQPTIFGSGDQARDFVYVEDVVNANLQAMDARLEGAYNVGTAATVTVNRIVEILKEHCGYKGDIVYAAERAGEVKTIALDSALLGSATGWRPRVTLEEGLIATVEYLRKTIGSA